MKKKIENIIDIILSVILILLAVCAIVANIVLPIIDEDLFIYGGISRNYLFLAIITFLFGILNFPRKENKDKMKITREFKFVPSWKSRGYSWQSYDDKFLIPDFNRMAKILNDRGWEIDSFEIIPDSRTYNKDEEFNSAKFICHKEVKGKYEEEGYTYFMTGKCWEMELHKEKSISELFKEAKEQRKEEK